MFKRTISISLLLAMTVALAAPVLHIDCDMPCCQEEVLTCCNTNQSERLSKTCKMDMKNCDMGRVFIPIVSGPFYQDKLNFQLDLQHAVIIANRLKTSVCYSKPAVLDHPPEPPPAYNIPILA